MIQTSPDDSRAPQAKDAEGGAGDRSYRALARAIQALIASGDIAPGARLPAERSLAERFGVSRTLVREAVIALEVQGIVEVRGGAGIYVTAVPSSPAAFGMAQAPGPIETLRARLLIESEIAAVAAQERNDRDLDHIFAALTRMRAQMHDKEANDSADRDFHCAIAGATGNGVLRHMVTVLWDEGRGNPMWHKIEAHFHTPHLRSASQEDHQRIFAAIVERQAEAARAAMRAHVQRVIGEFTQAWRSGL